MGAKIDSDTIYEVTRVAGKGNYRVRKIVYGGIVKDEYNLTMTQKSPGVWDLWCDCLGFRRQNYPKIEHKHVKLVLAYLDHFVEGTPEHIPLYFKLVGKNNDVKHVKNRWNTDE